MKIRCARIGGLALAGFTVSGQTNRGTLRGSVSDVAGAAIGGAGISVRNLSENQLTRVKSSQEGNFLVPALACRDRYWQFRPLPEPRPAQVSLRFFPNLAALADSTDLADGVVVARGRGSGLQIWVSSTFPARRECVG